MARSRDKSCVKIQRADPYLSVNPTADSRDHGIADAGTVVVESRGEIGREFLYHVSISPAIFLSFRCRVHGNTYFEGGQDLVVPCFRECAVPRRLERAAVRVGFQVRYGCVRLCGRAVNGDLEGGYLGGGTGGESGCPADRQEGRETD